MLVKKDEYAYQSDSINNKITIKNIFAFTLATDFILMIEFTLERMKWNKISWYTTDKRNVFTKNEYMQVAASVSLPRKAPATLRER